MKPELPNNITVGIHRYTVAEVLGAESWGRVDHVNKKITLRAELVESEKAITLLEEVGHACLTMSGAERNKSIAPENWQDLFLGGLCDLLLHTLRNNPALVRFLLEAGEENSE